MTAQDYLLLEKRETINLVISKPLEPLFIIGLDRSLVSTGFAVVCNGKYVDGCQFHSKFYGANRLKDLGLQILHRAKNYPNCIVIMEGYSYGSQGMSIVDLGELGGVVKTFLLMSNMRWLEAAPQSLKKYVTGIGNCEKNLLPMHILKRFGVQAIGNDHADAVGLAFLGYNAFFYAMNRSYPDAIKKYTQKEIECFETLLSLAKKEKKPKLTHRQLVTDVTKL